MSLSSPQSNKPLQLRNTELAQTIPPTGTPAQTPPSVQDQLRTPPDFCSQAAQSHHGFKRDNRPSATIVTGILPCPAVPVKSTFRPRGETAKPENPEKLGKKRP
jgi:hypothetical protein